MLHPGQFGEEFNVGDVSWEHSAADYGGSRKGREIRNTTEGTRKAAIMGIDREFRGTTDRQRHYAGPVDAKVSLSRQFVPHMNPGTN